MRKVVIAVICSSVLLGSAALEWSTSAQQVHPAATKKILTIPACAFTPGSTFVDYYSGSTLYTKDETEYFFAPIRLPHGSYILKVKLVCKDNSTSGNTELELSRSYHIEGGPHHLFGEALATAYSSGTEDNYRTFNAFVVGGKKIVNNRKYVYTLKLYMPGTGSQGFFFFKVQVIYSA